jgi:vitamin-K-epoxide reductase (warfarin-sensitive)
MFSCTKVFSSEFGYVSQFFGLPKISNAHVGMAFYVFELLIHRKFPNLFLLSSGASCLGSIGLFYLLTVKLNDFCIVCMSIYVVNFTSFFTIYRRLSRKRSSKRSAEAPERSLQAPETKKMR